MQEIKFRFRTKEGFIYGSSKIKSRRGLSIAYEAGETLSLGDFFFITGDEYEIQQWSGLKDKNGDDIYEGDLVMVCEKGNIMDGEIAEVIFEKQMFALSWINDREALFNWIRDFHNNNCKLEIIDSKRSKNDKSK